MGKEFVTRTNYVINKKFQLRFVATFLIIIILSLIIFSLIFSLFFWVRYMYGDNIFKEFIIIHKQVPLLDDNDNPIKGKDGKNLTTTEEQAPINRFEVLLPPLLINNLIIMILISIIGVFYSHTIAGPAYRMNVDISKVLSGEKGVRIRLRKKDKFKNLAAKINELIEEYDKVREK